MATTTAQRAAWVTNWRNQINALIAAAEAIKALNDEWVANNYSGTLVNGDLNGTSSSGILASDITSSVTNGLVMANSVVDNLGHTVAVGASATIFAIR